MAISYTNLFTNIGKVVAWVDWIESKQTDATYGFSARFSALLALMSTTNKYGAQWADNLRDIVMAAEAANDSIKLDIVNNTIRDFIAEELMDEMFLPSDDVTTLVDRLVYQMRLDDYYCDASSSFTTVGSSEMAYLGTESPVGAVIVYSMLYPNVIAEASCETEAGIPVGGVRAYVRNTDVTDLTKRGKEYFYFVSEAQGAAGNKDWHKLGTGSLVQMVSSVGVNHVSNGGMESGGGAGTPPTGWAISGGTWNVDVKMSADGDGLKGVQTSPAYALKWENTTAGGVAMATTFLPSLFTFGSKYIMGFWAKRLDTMGDTHVTMNLACGDLDIDIDYEIHGAADTNWHLQYQIFNVPYGTVLDEDAATVTITGISTTDLTDNFLIDEVFVAPMTRIGKGLHVVPIIGEGQVQYNDAWDETFTVDTTGNFHKFFRRFFNVQIPVLGTNAIDDDLAVDV